MALWEVFAPKRRQAIGRLRRWPANFALVAEVRGWGLFQWFPVPNALTVIVSVIVLDLAIYVQHVLFHAVPALWRLHRVHHANIEIDVTTGFRFYPLEILLSMILKFGVVIALGAPPAAVLVFEVLLNTTTMFNHGNVRVPPRLDAALRWLLVTPDMHRVHHSIVRQETDSNFGFNLPWWDRLFGTYRAQPEAGNLGMTIGIEQFRDPSELRIDRMLLQGSGALAAREPGNSGAQNQFQADTTARSQSCLSD